MRKYAVAVGIVVVLALLIGLAGLFRVGPFAEPDRPSTERGTPDRSGTPALTPEGRGDPAAGTDPTPGEEAPPDRDEPSGPGSGAAPVGSGSTGGSVSDDVPPALRPNPRAPPAPAAGGRSVGGAGRPPMGPTGLWERFPPLPPSGRASLSATVVDRTGAPVPGADVYLGPPSALGSGAVSFGDLRKVGRTDESGTLNAEKLPEGSAVLAANLGNLLNGPFGLDARTSVSVVLKPEETTKGTVRLPFAASEFGTVRGRVLDPDGEPVPGARIVIEYALAVTAAAGTFVIENVKAGGRSVIASRTGYRRGTARVTVEKGGTAEARIALTYREEGSLDLAGTVVDPGGGPVAEASVYLIVNSGSGRGTIRSVRSDEQGRFKMASLPDRLGDADIRIQANRSGYRPGNLLLPEGLDAGTVEVRLPLRLTKLALVVKDSGTGEPLTRCRFTATKEGRDRPVASFTSRDAAGRYEAWVEAGAHTFTIEAPDHDTLVVAVDVGAAGGEFEYVASLVPSGEKSVEVVLTVRLVSDADGTPVERARVEVSATGSGTALARLEGERPGGRFVLPVPSGRCRVRAVADGYEPVETGLDLRPEDPEVEIELRLRSR